MRDLQYAFRRLWRSLAFSIAAILTLAIAIGATASVFSLVDAILLKPFPFREADRVLVINESNPGQHFPEFLPSAPNWLDWRAQSRSFSMMALTTGRAATVTGVGEPERVNAVSVTPSFFPVLGVVPALGRTLAIDSSGPPEVVISYDYWQTHFGGKRSVPGRKLLIDDEPHIIVGVGPDGWPGGEQMWTRLSLTAADVAARENRRFFSYARLAPGVTRVRCASWGALQLQSSERHPRRERRRAVRPIFHRSQWHRGRRAQQCGLQYGCGSWYQDPLTGDDRLPARGQCGLRIPQQRIPVGSVRWSIGLYAPRSAVIRPDK